MGMCNSYVSLSRLQASAHEPTRMPWHRLCMVSDAVGSSARANLTCHWVQLAEGPGRAKIYQYGGRQVFRVRTMLVIVKCVRGGVRMLVGPHQLCAVTYSALLHTGKSGGGPLWVDPMPAVATCISLYECTAVSLLPLPEPSPFLLRKQSCSRQLRRDMMFPSPHASSTRHVVCFYSSDPLLEPSRINVSAASQRRGAWTLGQCAARTRTLPSRICRMHTGNPTFAEVRLASLAPSTTGVQTRRHAARQPWT